MTIVKNVILISLQVPVKSFQSSSQLLKEPMPDKHHPNHNQDNHNHESHDHNHHHHPHDLSTADTKVISCKSLVSSAQISDIHERRSLDS